MKTVLVVGGAGYIGSHVCKALSKAGFSPVTFDNLENGHRWAVRWGPLVEGDLHDGEALDQAFVHYQPVGVIHLASYINVRESAENPEKYFRNNVTGTQKLLESIQKYSRVPLVFSSTAAVYGSPQTSPIAEDHPLIPINVYGETKLFAEQLLDRSEIRYIALRYFNAAGADLEGEIGEAHDPETHLIPRAILSALGKTESFKIFGTDHPTPDGTALRDYIHVADLATAHVLALEWLLKGGAKAVLNLGSGKGHSVKEVVSMIAQKIKKEVPLEIAPRNLAEPPELIADITQAKKLLNWSPTHSDLETIIATALKWHQR